MQNVNRSVIGVAGDNRAENEAFIQFSRHFCKCGLPVPQIYMEDLAHGVYLETDLGFETLFEWMSRIKKDADAEQKILTLYRRVLEWLPKFQIIAGRDLDYSFCYQHDVFGKDSMNWDLQYFKHRFLDAFYAGPLDKSALLHDFQSLVAYLLEEKPVYFMYRDFQSRNVMVLEQQPYFIDYQSGRRGALQYDVASLLYDAKANLPESLRMELLEHYIAVAQQICNFSAQRFKQYFYGFVAIRIMQAFGAYGYLAAVKGKKSFLKSVPFAIQNLEILLHKAEILHELPVLRQVFSTLVEDQSLRQIGS
jgi:aminoglycoside/choline kinase family phosphotransferase